MTSPDLREEPTTSEVSVSGWSARVLDFLRDAVHIAWYLTRNARRSVLALWNAPLSMRLRRLALDARSAPWSGAGVIVVGAVVTTLFILALDHIILIPNHGSIYLPVIAFIAYYWNWRHGVIAALLDLFCIYFFFAPPTVGMKLLTPASLAQLLTDVAVIMFVLAVVQLGGEPPHAGRA